MDFSPPKWAISLQTCRKEVIRLRMKCSKSVVFDGDPLEITMAEYATVISEELENQCSLKS